MTDGSCSSNGSLVVSINLLIITRGYSRFPETELILKLNFSFGEALCICCVFPIMANIILQPLVSPSQRCGSVPGIAILSIGLSLVQLKDRSQISEGSVKIQVRVVEAGQTGSNCFPPVVMSAAYLFKSCAAVNFTT